MRYSEVKACLKEIDKDELRSLIEQFDEDLVNQYCQDGYGLSSMEEAYCGEFASDGDFTKELLESIGDIPDTLPVYVHIDWESTARDIMMDYFEIDGYYFRNL